MALQLKMDPTGIVLGAAQSRDALDGVAGAAGRAEKKLDDLSGASAQTFGPMGRDVMAARATFDSLRQSVDPAYAASVRYKDAVIEINTALRMNAVTQEEASALSTALASKLGVTAEKSILAGGGLRQLGMQLSQVGQQSMATGNFVQALAIQLPDIGLAFGSVGVAAGLLAGVALPMLMSAFGETKSAADRLADANDKIASSITGLRQIAEEFASGNLEALRKKYGEVDQALLTLIGHQREEQVIGAQNAARDAIKALADEYQVASGELNVFRITGGGAAKEVADKMGLTKNAFIAFQEALRAAQTAKNFDEQAAALAKVDGYLARSSANGSELANGVTDAALQMREVDAASKSSKDNMEKMPGALGAATSAASGLAGAMDGVAIAANAALARMIAMDAKRQAFQASQAAIQSAVQSAYKFSQTTSMNFPGNGGFIPSGTGQVQQEKFDAEVKRLTTPITPPASRGGSSGSVAKELTDAEKAQIALNDAIQKGTDVYGTFQDAAGNAIDKLISGTGNLKSALRDMIKEMEIALIKGTLLGHVTGATADMSIGQLLVKGIFSGFHDAGGTIGPGQVGVVGERGPELVTAGANGATVTGRVETARMMQQQVHVSVSVDDDGKIRAYVQQSGRSAAANAIQTVKRSLPGWNSQLQTDGALA